jgi:WD40 repeat protein
VEGRVEGPRGITHQYHIVGCHWVPDFDQLMTIDAIGNVATWNYNLGGLEIVRSIHVTEINESVIDLLGRRLITTSFEGDVRIWNPSSGGHIADIDTRSESQVTTVKFVAISGRTFLVTGGWSKNVSVYREIEPSVFELHGAFSGHEGDICAIGFEPGIGMIITGSVTGEVFGWSIEAKTIAPRRARLEDNTPVEAICVSDHYAFIGDSNGFLNVLSVPHLAKVMRKRGRTDPVPCAVSAIAIDSEHSVLLTGDTLGCVAIWHITIISSLSLVLGKTVPCHTAEVTKIEVIPREGLCATVGLNMAVRLWATETLECVGTFDSSSRWDVRDVTSWKRDSPIETGVDTAPMTSVVEGLREGSSKRNRTPASTASGSDRRRRTGQLIANQASANVQSAAKIPLATFAETA